MEPKLPTPNPSPERGPVSSTRSIEYGGSIDGVEIAGEGREQHEANVEQAREQLNVGLSNAGAPQVAVPQAPIQASSTFGIKSSDDDDTPLVAADDDLIEREWVDKAKRIVSATRDDPFAQEREVSKLQASYLQKRYGKEIKLSNQ